MRFRRYTRDAFRRLLPMAIGASALFAGCAHQKEQGELQEEQALLVSQLQNRLEEVERTNGRLNVRIDDLEDTLFLLQDRSESNRIALQRRGLIRPGNALRSDRPEAPSPAPESYYYPGNPNPYGAAQGRRVTRIPRAGSPTSPRAGAQPLDEYTAQPQPPADRSTPSATDPELVITEEDFRDFAGPAPRQPQRPSSPQPATTKKKRAQAPVTSETLRTSEARPEPTSARPIDTYKRSLALYRAGKFSDALSGFEAFLRTNPRADYVDNALYWIGECHFGLRRLQKALDYFERVLDEQPDGNKVPDAMLKMSVAYEQLGQPAKARELLETLTTRYPATNAGRLGAKRLSQSP